MTPRAKISQRRMDVVYRKRHTFRQGIAFRPSGPTVFGRNTARVFISRLLDDVTPIRHDARETESAYTTVVPRVRGCGTSRTCHAGRLRLDRAPWRTTHVGCEDGRSGTADVHSPSNVPGRHPDAAARRA